MQMVLNGPSDNLLCSYKPYTFAQKVVKNKGMGFDIFTKKHLFEAQIHQIRVKKYPYYLYFDEFLNIFHYICNAILCAYIDLRGLIYAKMGGKYIT